MKPWVVDASPLLFLAKIDRLAALRNRAPRVLIPEAVLTEVLAYADPAASMVRNAAETWLHIAAVKDRKTVETLLADIGPGEAEVIALARERAADRVVMDDLDARRFARRSGLEPIGTLGLLLAARLRGEIPSLRTEIAHLREIGFYASKALIGAILVAAGEA